MIEAAQEVHRWRIRFVNRPIGSFRASANDFYRDWGICCKASSSSLLDCDVIRGIQSASRTVFALHLPYAIKTGVTNLQSRFPGLSSRAFEEKWNMSSEILSSQAIDSWIGSLDLLLAENLLPLVMREPFARAEMDEKKSVRGGFIVRDISLLQEDIWAPGFSIPQIFPNDPNAPDRINVKYHQSVAMLQARLLDRYGIWHANLHRQNVRVRISNEGELTDHAIAIDLSDFGIIKPIARYIVQKHSVKCPSDQIFPSIRPHPNYGQESSKIVELHLKTFASELEKLWNCPGEIMPIFQNCQEQPDDRRKMEEFNKAWRIVSNRALSYDNIAWIHFNDWLNSERASKILETRYQP